MINLVDQFVKFMIFLFNVFKSKHNVYLEDNGKMLILVKMFVREKISICIGILSL
jgi:hypothetical protein